MAKKDRQRFIGAAFPSGNAMTRIPLTPEYAERVLEQVREAFPYRRFRPKLKFDHRASGPWGRWGEADHRKNTITIWRRGMNLDTLMHEIAHILTGPGHGHDKDFYFTCEVLEKELFYCKLPD